MTKEKKPVSWSPYVQVAVFILAWAIKYAHPSRNLDKTVAFLNYMACAGGKDDTPKHQQALDYSLRAHMNAMKNIGCELNAPLARYGRTTIQTALRKCFLGKEIAK